jgi:GNAT superfamily N-acetyltransferase
VIKRAETPPDNIDDDVSRCQINALRLCYEGQGLLSFWRCESGGFLCGFEDRLIVTGDVDAGELAAFAGMLGVSCICGADAALPYLPGFSRQTHRVMIHGAPLPPGAAAVRRCDLGAVYEILLECFPKTFSRRGYLHWLSDINRRIRLAGGIVLYDEGGATASVLAAQGEYALIGAVAALAKSRGRGLAGGLVARLCAVALERSQTALTVAEVPELERFYRNLGFLPHSMQATLTRNIAGGAVFDRY